MLIPTPVEGLAKRYLEAKAAVLMAGFAEEIVLQENAGSVPLTESRLLEEHAWVTISTGMREAIVRRKFPMISSCFFEWQSAALIHESALSCFHAAVRVFNHPQKIQAIIDTATFIAAKGFEVVATEIRTAPLTALRQLPYIGPVTVYHLAKNIGTEVAKPDRHLVRIAQACGYNDVQEFCGLISSFTGDAISVVDLVLWRWATISHHYLRTFS